MSETFDNWMCGLSGLAFITSSSYAIGAYYTYTALMKAPRLSVSDFFASKDTYLNHNVFLYGKATGSPPIKVLCI